MKTVTFYSNTRYAGGRSHRNINTLEFVEGKDIIEAAEMYGYNVYPLEGEDFEKGVKDWNGNEVMDADEYLDFKKTGTGRLDFGETVFCTMLLEDIGVEEFKILPADLQLDYIHIWYETVTDEMLKHVDISEAYDYTQREWDLVQNEILQLD